MFFIFNEKSSIVPTAKTRSYCFFINILLSLFLISYTVEGLKNVLLISAVLIFSLINTPSFPPS